MRCSDKQCSRVKVGKYEEVLLLWGVYLQELSNGMEFREGASKALG